MRATVTNVRIAGLGGQGVITAANILSEVAFRSGADVKQSELHGMSQRGGSVASDVRFGAPLYSPMIPWGEIDYLLVLTADQEAVHASGLRPGAKIVRVGLIPADRLPASRTLNVAVLGVLSGYLPMAADLWLNVLHGLFPAERHAANEQAFHLGRKIGVRDAAAAG